MLWPLLAIFAYFLNALVVVIDKAILSVKVKDPLPYAFYGAVLNSAAFLLWIFDFSFLSLETTVYAFLAGVSFFAAIYFMYAAMVKGEASRVISIIGAVSPLTVLSLSYLFLDERLPSLWLVAFSFLVLGGLFLTVEKDEKSSRFRFLKGIPLNSFLSGIFWALTFFLTKVVFLDSTFINGFVWIRTGTIFVVAAVFLAPSARARVLKSPLGAAGKVSLSFLANKIASAASFVVLSFAIKMGTVSIVNALQGTQYGFIFIFGLIIYLYKSKLSQESFKRSAVLQKISGIVLVSLGVAILFLFK